MALVTSFGRFDRAAIVIRAREIQAKQNCTWTIAMRQTYIEARAERDGTTPEDIATVHRIRSLAREADRLTERENAR